MAKAVAQPERPLRGRPRDPSLESRVFDAAIALYAEGGWRSFTFDAIAKQASVGKSALYRRWATRGDLLRETLEARWYFLEDMDTGSLEGDLTALAQMCMRTLTGPYGGVMAHFRVDLTAFEEVSVSTAPYARSMMQKARGIIRRAITRGEAPASTSPGLIIDVLFGAITNHVAVTPKGLRDEMLAKRDQFLKSLVALILVGLRGRA